MRHTPTPSRARLSPALALAFLGLLLTIPASVSAAERLPDGCYFDTVHGFGGVAVVDAIDRGPEEDYPIDLDQVVDSQGRVFAIVPSSDETSATIARWYADGTSDDGFVAQTVSTAPGAEREIAVDAAGRVWFAHTDGTALLVRELESQQAVDLGVATPPGSVYGLRLQLLADGDLLLAFGRDDDLVAVRIDPDAMTASAEVVAPDFGSDLARFPSKDVTADGVIVGEADNGVADGLASFVWWPTLAGGSGVPMVAYGDFDSEHLAFATATPVDGGVRVGGWLALSDTVQRGMVLDVDLGGASPSIDETSLVLLDPEYRVVHVEGDEVFAYDDFSITSHRIEDGAVVGRRAVSRWFDDFEQVSSGTTPGGDRILAWSDPQFSAVKTMRIGTEALGPRPAATSLADQLSRLYAAYLGRTPDEGGLEFWSQQRAAGMSVGDVSAAFAASPEFADTYGALDDGEFVDLVYQNVLGRAPDAGGQFWVDWLGDGGDRGGLMARFSESDEFVESTGTVAPHSRPAGSVERLYRAYFERDPDAGGACFWERRLGLGDDLRLVSSSFAASDEFLMTYGSLDDGEFVDLVYQNVLGRAPDAGGLAFWIDELASGRRTRGEVMIGFSESAEFVLATGTLPPN